MQADREILTAVSVFVVVAFFARGLAVLALALVSVFFGAAAFLAVVALVAVFLGAAAFFVVVFGLDSFSAFSTFSTFSAFGLASFLGAAGFFSVVFGTFFASLTGPEGPVQVSSEAMLSKMKATYPLVAQTHLPSHLA